MKKAGYIKPILTRDSYVKDENMFLRKVKGIRNGLYRQ